MEKTIWTSNTDPGKRLNVQGTRGKGQGTRDNESLAINFYSVKCVCIEDMFRNMRYQILLANKEKRLQLMDIVKDHFNTRLSITIH